MTARAIAEALSSLEAPGELAFTLRELPLDELLLRVHAMRFTGVLQVGVPPDVDRVFFREGSIVGVLPMRAADAPLIGDVLVQMKLLSRETLAAALDDTDEIDGVELGRRLADSGLIRGEDLERVFEEQARRRLFHLYDLDEAVVVVARAGLDHLAHFHPTYVDVRPAIAFGIVVRSSPDRKEEIMQRTRGRRVRLLAPYDEKRNGYGLPPPVLNAMRLLSQGVSFDDAPIFPGLSSQESAGVLLLSDRMSLLALDP